MVYLGLLLFFFVEYMRPGAYVPVLNVLRLNLLVPVGVLLGTAFSTSPVTNGQIARETNSKIIGGLLGLILVSMALTAEVTLYAFDLFKAVLGYTLVYWVIVRQVSTLDRLKGLFVTLAAVHLLLAALTPQMFLDPDGRHALSSGTFLGDGNDYALSVDIVIPFCLFLLFETKRTVGKVLWGSIILVLVLCVVATKSRGGTLGLAAVGLYYWWKTDKKVVTGMVAALAIAVVIAIAPPSYFERMNTITSHEDGSAQGRLTAWRAAVGMAISNPLFGAGAGQFTSNFPRFAPAGPEGPHMRWTTAHSIYFLILGELGLPGLGLLIGFIVSNIAANRRALKELRARGVNPVTEGRLLACLSVSVLAYAVAGAFLSATYYPHMFVIAGLSVAGRRLAREHANGAVPVAPPEPVRAAWDYRPPIRRSVNGRRVS